MSITSRTYQLALLTLFTTGSVAWGQAQTGFQFNFISPGARSLGMGGAFIGLADDATAAYTNPAGLTNLTIGGSEAAIEYRQFSNTTLFPAGGRLDGSNQATGIGIDTRDDLVIDEAAAETGGIAFFSYSKVLPRGITLAVYRHQLANYSVEYASQGPFLTDLYTCLCSRNFPSFTRVDLRIANYGASAAYAFQLSSDDSKTRLAGSISVGLGLTVSELDLNFQRYFFGFDERTGFDWIDRQPGGFFGPADFTPDNVFAKQLAQDSDYAQGFNLGALWKQGGKASVEARGEKEGQTRRWDYLLHGQWSAGAVYRKGPSFQVDGTMNGIEGSSTLDIRVPDTYGLGVAYSMDEGNTKVTLDYDRVRWSQRFDEIIPKGRTLDRENFSLADADEVHLGFEQVVFVLESQIIGTLRLGAWREPAHEVEYRGPTPANRVLFPTGRDINHWSAGIGIVLKEDFQIDTALDISDRAKTVSFSLVKFF